MTFLPKLNTIKREGCVLVSVIVFVSDEHRNCSIKECEEYSIVGTKELSIIQCCCSRNSPVISISNLIVQVYMRDKIIYIVVVGNFFRNCNIQAFISNRENRKAMEGKGKT